MGTESPDEKFSPYYGDAHSTPIQTTGFFEIQLGGNGTYHFIDPLGYRFYSLGINSVKVPAGTADKRAWGRETTSFLATDVGANTMGSWSTDAFVSSLLVDANGVPLGVTSQLGEDGEPPLPRTPNLRLLSLATEDDLYNDAEGNVPNPSSRLRALWNYLVPYMQEDKKVAPGTPDYEMAVRAKADRYELFLVFEPNDAFRLWVRHHLSQVLTPALVADPRVLGYFLDNEIHVAEDLLDAFLQLPPATSQRLFAEQYMTQMSGVLGSNYAGARTAVLNRSQGGANTELLRHGFIERVMSTYFQVVSEEIRGRPESPGKPRIQPRDPNHLLLGTRFNATTKGLLTDADYVKITLWEPHIFRAAGPYVDVVSVNLYGHWAPSPNMLSRWHEYSRKPSLISEFYTKGQYTQTGTNEQGNCGGAGWIVERQWQRGRYYQNFLIHALRHPTTVGVHWFKYMDEFEDPGTGASAAQIAAGTNNKGLVDPNDVQHELLVNKMGEVNTHVYKLRPIARSLCDNGALPCLPWYPP